jgi:hypothetical protein
VVLLAVPVPSRAVATLPEARLLAFKDVRLAPLAAGSVAGKRASGTVPEPRFDAFKAVRLTPLAAGKVAGNRASGTVPEAKLLAFRFVRLEPLPAEGVPISPPEIYSVPVTSGSVTVRSEFVVGAVIVTVPVPVGVA